MMIPAAAYVSRNMHVAMLCFASGIMLIINGWYVWKKVKPELLPGYKKVENEDRETFSRLAGQAHIFGGIAMLLLSFPLNEENPNFIFTVVMFIGFLVMMAMAISRYARASRSRRK